MRNKKEKPIPSGMGSIDIVEYSKFRFKSPPAKLMGSPGNASTIN